MRILGLDIGEKRVGVAVSDASGTVASPVDVVAAAMLSDRRAMMRLVEDWDIGLLVVGLPLTLDGQEGPQALAVRQIADALAARLGLPLKYHDERLSSSSARSVMREAGLSERRQRGSLDKVAAAIMLQGYLDANQSGDARG